jgi:peptide chain release factor 1
VTVAVLGRDGETADSVFLRRSKTDFILEWYSGSGCGGQHRNKHMTSVKIKHRPTGIMRTAQTRSRENSLAEAMRALEAELDALAVRHGHNADNGRRVAQIGSGERADKTRTFRFQADEAIDHRTGRRARLRDVMAGRFDLLG